VTDEFPDRIQTHQLQLPISAAGTRLDQALAQALPQYSRSRLQAWIEAGLVLIDGRKPRPRDKVLGGEQVVVEAHFAASTAVAAEERPVDVVYQDQALLIVNKPAGLVVHPGAGNQHGTLQNALLALDPELARVPRAGIVHRLDKDTSGLLLVARTPEVHAILVDLLAERAIEREYLALVHGALTGGGKVDAAIGRHRSDRLKMTVRVDGRDAITHYRIERRFPVHTLVRVRLETGRTHQIRVHFAHIGYPIVGDQVYGGRKRTPAGASPDLLAALAGFRRQALHAVRLALAHPLTGKPVSVEAPLPADFVSLLAALAKVPA
jgi:23S rRNA pseudouridine1911/1915/1917 synthase